MQRFGEHPVAAGPLSVRWLSVQLEPPRAGAIGRAQVVVENAGLATWRPLAGNRGVKASYHWLDTLGNPLFWDGLRTELPYEVAPGARVELDLAVRAAMPPGRYRLAFDLVDETKRWFAEVGSFAPELAVDVAPRVERRLGVTGADAGALAGQDEAEALVPLDEAAAVARLAPGVEPASDWARLVLDSHQEGYGVVGGAISAASGPLRRQSAALAAWAPGGGRNPGFALPLLCPSVALDALVEEAAPIAGLPAVRPSGEEPWVYDGRITARLRSDRPRA